MPVVGRHQGIDFIALERSLAEASRVPKRHKGSEEGSRGFKGLCWTIPCPTRPGLAALDKRHRNDVRQRGCVRLQDQTCRSAVLSEKSELSLLRNTRTSPWAEDLCLRFLAAKKRPAFKDCSQSIIEQLPGPIAKCIDLVVILDIERELCEEDEWNYKGGCLREIFCSEFT